MKQNHFFLRPPASFMTPLDLKIYYTIIGLVYIEKYANAMYGSAALKLISR